MVTVCFTNFSYLTGDSVWELLCLGTTVWGQLFCFLVWVWLGCLTAAKKASADFRGKEKVGDGSPGL
jgi:hypothetical protein